MVDITELKKNVERLNKSTTAASKKQSYTLVQKTIAALESNYGSMQKELLSKEDSLEQLKKENLALKQDYTILNGRVQELLKKKTETEKQLEQLSRTRPELSSENLVRAFRDSLENMDDAINSSSSRVNYNISSMNIKLRTNLAVQDDELRFQLPKADDIIPVGNLSEVEFTISSSSKESDLTDHVDVPNIIGLDMDSAVSIIESAGFSKGEITEKASDLPQGTVLFQIPSGNSVAMPGDAVDMEISMITSVPVPDMLGMTLVSAKNALAERNLFIGKVTEKPNALKVGTILSQSVVAGKYVDIGTAIDVVVASEKVLFAEISRKKETSPLTSVIINTPKSTAKLSVGKQISRLSSIRNTISR